MRFVRQCDIVRDRFRYALVCDERELPGVEVLEHIRLYDDETPETWIAAIHVIGGTE